MRVELVQNVDFMPAIERPTLLLVVIDCDMRREESRSCIRDSGEVSPVPQAISDWLEMLIWRICCGSRLMRSKARGNWL